MVRYRCRFCGVLLETDEGLTGQSENCPSCGSTNSVPPRPMRRVRSCMERVKTDLLAWKRIRKQEARRRAVAFANEQREEARARRYQEHVQAVLSGSVFDAELLVAHFHHDWLEVQQDTGLTPMQISQGVKSVSPAVGAGVGYFSGNPWMGLLAGVLSYLASDSVASEYARTQFEKWRLKWMRIFSCFDGPQLYCFAQLLQARHPLVFHSLQNGFDSLRLPGS